MYRKESVIRISESRRLEQEGHRLCGQGVVKNINKNGSPFFRKEGRGEDSENGCLCFIYSKKAEASLGLLCRRKRHYIMPFGGDGGEKREGTFFCL